MSVVVRLFTRSPFDVQAVQVTTANIGEVAVWCKGTIHEGVKSLYIKLDIPDAKSSVRQQAFPGDWILLSDQGYRIYTERALESNFIEKVAPKVSDEVRRAAIREIVLNTIMAHDDHVNPRGNKGVNKIVESAVDDILRAS
jgi:hypothetical protein